MFQGNREGVDLIISEAKSIFTTENLIVDKDGEPPKTLNGRLVDAIVKVIADAGIVYLSTREDVIDLWEKIREEDESGLSGWLMQAAITWRIRSFPSGSSWETWCGFLSDAYGQQKSGSSSRSGYEENVCVDDDTVDRLASKDEFKNILISNPWFTYLVTLQLSWHEIYGDLISMGHGQLNVEGDS